MKSKSNPLLSLVESFFRDYLSKMRGASPHTIKAYRDSLRLFFIFVAERRKRAVATLQLEDLRVEAVSAFLDHLESQRANTAASRNYRLAALRSFFKHLVRHDLSHAEQYQRVLALESKKTRITPADYLEAEDVRLILKQPDLRSEAGARDYALLLFLYNTGARVSEALTVRVQDLSLQRPRQVRLHGKGRVCCIQHTRPNVFSVYMFSCTRGPREKIGGFEEKVRNISFCSRRASNGFEKVDQAWVSAPAFRRRSSIAKIGSRKGFRLHFKVNLSVDVCRAQRYMSEPRADSVDVNSSAQQMTRARMSAISAKI